MDRLRRYKFGTVEIIAIIFGILGISYLGHWAHLASSSSIIMVLGYVEVLALALFAAVFGPYAGMIIGMAGTVLSLYFVQTQNGLALAVAMGLYGFIVGYYSSEFGILSDKYVVRDAFRMLSVILLANVLVFTLTIPLLNFYNSKMDIIAEMKRGAYDTAWISAFIVVFLSPLCWVVNIIYTKIIKLCFRNKYKSEI